jgi:hypothetical protein
VQCGQLIAETEVLKEGLSRAEHVRVLARSIESLYRKTLTAKEIVKQPAWNRKRVGCGIPCPTKDSRDADAGGEPAGVRK